jgi:hypothetical protein
MDTESKRPKCFDENMRNNLEKVFIKYLNDSKGIINCDTNYEDYVKNTTSVDTDDSEENTTTVKQNDTYEETTQSENDVEEDQNDDNDEEDDNNEDDGIEEDDELEEDGEDGEDDNDEDDTEGDEDVDCGKEFERECKCPIGTQCKLFDAGFESNNWTCPMKKFGYIPNSVHIRHSVDTCCIVALASIVVNCVLVVVMWNIN